MGRKPSPDFAEDKERCLLVYELARDFGKLPSDIEALSPFDLGLCIVAWREGRMHRARAAVKAQAMPVTEV